MRDELVKGLAADQLLEVIQEVEALLVGDRAEGVVRVDAALEVGDELGVLVVGAVVVDGVLEGLPADDGGEVPLRLAVDGGAYPALDVDGPSLVEPEVLPAAAGYEISAPAVGKLVGDDVYVLAVTADEGGCRKRVDGVLHACDSISLLILLCVLDKRLAQLTSVREARGEHQHVVLAPLVREDQLLGDLDELLNVPLQLPLGVVELLGPGRDLAARSNLRGGDVSGGQGKQVRRDGHLLLKDVRRGHVVLVQRLRGQDAAGDDGERGRDVEGVGGLDVGCVLAGEQRAGVDGLALREHVRVLPVGRLRGREPLQRGAVLGGLHLDAQLHDVALLGALGHRDAQRGPEGLGGVLEPPLGLRAADGDGADVEVARIEHNLPALPRGARDDVIVDTALERLRVEVDGEVGRRVLGEPRGVIGERAGVPVGGHVGGCRCECAEVTRACAGRERG